MKNMTFLALTLIAYFVTACQKSDQNFSGFPDKWQGIRPEMSKEEIIKNYGHPLRKYTKTNGEMNVEFWEYVVDFGDEYPEGKVWNDCTVIFRNGVVISLEFGGVAYTTKRK